MDARPEILRLVAVLLTLCEFRTHLLNAANNRVQKMGAWPSVPPKQTCPLKILKTIIGPFNIHASTFFVFRRQPLFLCRKGVVALLSH